VVRTIEVAENELRQGSTLVSLGDIIHNPKEIERLDRLGMSTISGDDLVRLPHGTKVLIRAHGEPPETYRKAGELGIELVDATCPVVTKLQERIRRFYDEGYQVVIFGKKEHAEVIGLRGVCNDECTVIKSLEEAENLVDLSKKTVLFSQTTMDKQTFHSIKEYLSTKIDTLIVDSMEELALEFHAKDTICGQVSGREQKLREFASENDVVIFVAGKKSSNGKVLFEVSKSANPLTHFIEDPNEIDPAWLENAETVGISGATSTPQWLMQETKIKIEELTKQLSHVA
jgi:4-hydroxy-3-methylbut-2-enyl diphosphate reductase